MISGFLFLTMLILIVAIVSSLLLSRSSRLVDVHGRIGELQIYTLMLFKNDNDFFDLESTNEEYFSSHKSQFLITRNSLVRKVNQLLTSTKQEGGEITKELGSIDSLLTTYNIKFKQLETLVFTKGLKDHGLEGEMRIHAHKLEDPKHKINIIDILSLRRHEKDFFLRQDTAYVALFRERIDMLLLKMKAERNQYQFEIHHLQEYRNTFLKLVDVYGQIGLTSSSGLRNELNALTFMISNNYLKLASYSHQISSDAQQKARLLFMTLVSCGIIFSLLSGIWISRKLSEPIATLSMQVKNLVKNEKNPKSRIDFNLKKSAKEIQILARAFNQLLAKSETQLAEIREKSRLLKKKNRELKQLNKELDNFLYSTAHDLRSPLASLLGLINLFSYETERGKVDAYAAMMKESVIRMEDFISQIVSYSKNKSLQLNFQRIDINQVLGGIINSHKFMDGTNKIHWIIDIKADTPIYTDQNRISILLSNLISNAIKYSDHNKEKSFVRIEVRSDVDYVHITFIDNGIGISEEHLNKVFDMFYRASLASKGSGLGLYILQQTIKRLKGFIQLESKYGEGTKFLITLPNQLETVSKDKKIQLLLT